MTSFNEELLALRLRAIVDLFAQLPADVEFIGVQVDGDKIVDAEFADASGKALFPYPDEGTLSPLNTAFGLHHEGLRAFAVAYPDIPRPVRITLLSMSGYRAGYPLVFRRPRPSGVNRTKQG